MYRRSEAGFGSFGAAPAWPLELPAFTPAPAFGRAGLAPPTSSHFDFDLVTDLGADIGSRRWWRGLATCLTLLFVTWTLSPPRHALPGWTPTPLSPSAWEESRAQSIAPLAWGGDTGLHMGATSAVQPLAGTPERPTLELAASIGQGDGLAHALERSGVSDSDARRVMDLTAAVTDPSAIAPGTALAIQLGRHTSALMPRPLDALAFRASFDTQVSFKRVGNSLTMTRTPIAVDHTPFHVSGSVGDGIYVSATAAGAPPKAVETFIRALAPKVEMGEIDANARFDMIVERDRAATGDVRFGKLLFVGLSEGDRATRMIEWTIDGRTEWYDAAGVGAPRGGFAVPVDGAHKTSGYGMRMHPILGYSRMHQGVDYGALYGTPIHAVTDGIVGFAGWHGGHGNMVKLAHAGGLGTGYGHMSRIIVAPGARVSQGQIIGYVGSTGLSTGPHLHFEVYRNGVTVDPGSVNFQSTPLLSGAALAAFHARLSAITAVAR